jgi:hypothetical protein
MWFIMEQCMGEQSRSERLAGGYAATRQVAFPPRGVAGLHPK